MNFQQHMDNDMIGPKPTKRRREAGRLSPKPEPNDGAAFAPPALPLASPPVASCPLVVIEDSNDEPAAPSDSAHVEKDVQESGPSLPEDAGPGFCDICGMLIPESSKRAHYESTIHLFKRKSLVKPKIGA